MIHPKTKLNVFPIKLLSSMDENWIAVYKIVLPGMKQPISASQTSTYTRNIHGTTHQADLCCDGKTNYPSWSETQGMYTYAYITTVSDQIPSRFTDRREEPWSFRPD